MKKIILALLCCWGFCSSLFAQEEEIGRDSLPVFVIRDRGLAAAFDDFIDRAKAVNRPGTIFGISFGLLDIDSKDIVDIYMYVVQPPEPQDSLAFYEPQHYHWAFIRHRNVLFRARFASYATSFNYYLLTDMLEKLPRKQKICLKDPPPGYYSGPICEYDDSCLLEDFYEYDGKEWSHGIREYPDDIEAEYEFID
ncbi:hypothetical protein [Alistipes sp.]|uniref:hypothetical protein n=1 Tax=Alistipes sp. TaxID=1872444 RepID=UPI0025B9416A|nr:hypothetical protein [Alistipes sp.]MCI7139725.1 hypothetical protein [Alistipes sp.]MDY5396699.1 hypothetical protein [Alistipes sp.]